MSGFLLDTHICISVIKEHPSVVQAVMRRSPDMIFVAAISVAELYFGERKSKRSSKNRAAVDAFLEPLTILDFDRLAAEAYADSRLALELAGTPLHERDLMIASTALGRGLTVVTKQARMLRRVPGLKVEDWTKT